MTYSDFEARWRPAGGAERAQQMQAVRVVVAQAAAQVAARLHRTRATQVQPLLSSDSCYPRPPR